MAVYKRFKALLRFVNGRYYRGIESGCNRLGMALNTIVPIWYVIDSQYNEVVGELG